MKLLLDTHSLVWFSNGDSRLSEASQAHLSDPDNELLLSLASDWEMAIKVSIGKLDLPDEIGEFLTAAQSNVAFDFLSIERNHLYQVATLPFHHRDPFDRLLIAQSIVELSP